MQLASWLRLRCYADWRSGLDHCLFCHLAIVFRKHYAAEGVKIAGLFGDAALEAREKFVELGVKSSKVVRS